MFNERGYYKSNSINYDENEIISDFNGNLMYSIPMYNFKRAGDLNINVSLNYNGSVAHNIYNGLTFQLGQVPFPLHQNNMSIPAWMINLNGMAVQLLNFEEKFLTHNLTQAVEDLEEDLEIAADSVKLLANGYHVTDRLKAAGTDRDIIMIMTGDGSTISLENVNANYGGTNKYTGFYFSAATKSYIKARVEYIDGGIGGTAYDTYRDRIMYLTKGDGLTYVYREYAYQFRDFTYWTGSGPYLKPQAFRLIEIVDKYGHSIKLRYNSEMYGRPTLNSIYEDYDGGNYINFDYHREYSPISLSFSKIDVRSSQGNYQIFDVINEPTRPRMMVTSIVNPSNQTATINYNTYHRTATGIRNAWQTTTFNAYFTLHLSRMTEFVNYAGGKRIYSYGSDDVNLSVNMHPNDNTRAHSSLTHGQGRDEYFVNMLEQKIINDKIQEVSKTVYSYPYTPVLDGSRTSEFITPVDARDTYRTITNTTSLTENLNNGTDTIKSTERIYRNYPIEDHYQPVMVGGLDPFTPDIQGETKLTQEIFKSGLNAQVIKTIDYIHNPASKTLLDSIIIETVNGISTTKQIKYQQFVRDGSQNLDFSIYQQNNPISRKIEIDPNGKRTVTSYKLFNSESIFY
jgi:hypothetical protein